MFFYPLIYFFRKEKPKHKQLKFKENHIFYFTEETGRHLQFYDPQRSYQGSPGAVLKLLTEVTVFKRHRNNVLIKKILYFFLGDVETITMGFSLEEFPYCFMRTCAENAENCAF